MKPFLLAVALLTLAGQSAFAQDCANAQDQTTMNICAGQSYKAADAELNATYKTLMVSVSPDGGKRLKAAQRAWIAYRDAECAFETLGTADGSIHSMIVSGCLEDLTRAQTARLNAQLNCQEGDLSCGGQ
ncbi:MAG: hypothetical protein DI533_14940 [Cereibacter sphaeroides]|uniref:Lysozyme inhibitor LprI-like N-terminal domain-containing protein n=1 Tax=Cereibacter sphaeroides TaxID=1063 RepID=A0A2W5UFS6_CERSP|nr:MAG: hypothetical protein DI533_14940 [Cereibacter sphaeroides]